MPKKEYPFTVVYIYAPEQYKDDYMQGKQIPNLKIGETGCELDDCQTCMEVAMKRINQQSTGFKEYMYLLQWFVFPYKQGIDKEIRKILTEDIYHLTTSERIDKVNTKSNNKDIRRTKIGYEFTYDVSLSQVNTAISVYKLKSKMEELINDRSIDPSFKIRLKDMINELLENLDDVIDESAQSMNLLPIAEQKKIKQQSMYSEELEMYI